MEHIVRYCHILMIILASLTSFNIAASLAMSDKKAAKIGKEMYEKLIKETPVYENKKINSYVSDIGQRLVKNSDQPNKSFTFTVLDNPQINAFATPGGYIYINRGLLTYMNSEAQLAAVLAHEIAHLTEKHHSRQSNANIGNIVVANVVAILTRSSDVGEATAMWGTAAIRGYGREMELEADAVGAKYLNRAGYPTSAVINMLSQPKAHERFTISQALDAGKKPRTYHGLFATHPRGDKRLLAAVKQADQGKKSVDARVVPFRIATEGLTYGVNYRGQKKQDNRFYDPDKTFTFDYPEGWEFKKTGTTIKGQSEDKSATFIIDIQPRTEHEPPEYIKKVLNIPFIQKSEALTVAHLNGHTGIIPAPGVSGVNQIGSKRLAILYYGFRVFVFTGQVANNELNETHGTGAGTGTYDEEFQSIISSFRPSSGTNGADQQLALHYVKVRETATYRKLAGQLRLGVYGDDKLRLINGHYPRGEPEAGQWIKILR